MCTEIYDSYGTLYPPNFASPPPSKIHYNSISPILNILVVFVMFYIPQVGLMTPNKPAGFRNFPQLAAILSKQRCTLMFISFKPACPFALKHFCSLTVVVLCWHFLRIHKTVHTSLKSQIRCIRGSRSSAGHAIKTSINVITSEGCILSN